MCQKGVLQGALRDPRQNTARTRRLTTAGHAEQAEAESTPTTITK